MAEGDYLTRRQRIAQKKRDGDDDAENDEPPKKKRGPKAKAFKRPAAAKPKRVSEDAQAAEQGEEENPPAQDEVVEEGVNSSSSTAPLRRGGHVDEAMLQESSPAEPKARAKAKTKAKVKATSQPGTAAQSAAAEPEGANVVAHAAACRAAIQAALKTCREAGELGKTGKHCHPIDVLSEDFVQLSVYHSRGAVGVKIRDSITEPWQQVAYFSRPTPCVSSNVVIAKMWVLASVVYCWPCMSSTPYTYECTLVQPFEA